MNPQPPKLPEGFLLINKPKGRTSFSLVAALRKRLGVKKIGHAGTLDPFATGVMILLVGKEYTKRSDSFLCQDKEYVTRLHLGIETDSYDIDGTVLATSDHIPSLDDITKVIQAFQGEILQMPPMFSAKKINGKKLYELARKGQTIERPLARVNVQVELLDYHYPYLDLAVKCSKGTYIRSLAFDMGKMLLCGAHLCELKRTRSGHFSIEECVDGHLINDPEIDIAGKLRTLC